MAVEEYFPFDAGPGATVAEGGWGRMSRLWAPPGVVGSSSATGAYNLTVSGLNATITRRPGPLAAEAWVDGFMHRLVDADKTFAVPVNTNANPRVDRIVLHRDLVANTIALTLLQGAPAASPVAPALTQVDGGVYELPLWRFTVPASSGTPLTGLVDDRVWIDPNPTGVTGAVVGYGGTSATATLYPGRVYTAHAAFTATPTSNNAGAVYATVRGIAGSTAPTGTAGTALGPNGIAYEASSSTASNGNAWGAFTVATAKVYSIAASGAATGQTITSQNVVVIDGGPSAGLSGLPQIP